jgi:hypothetical protein
MIGPTNKMIGVVASDARMIMQVRALVVPWRLSFLAITEMTGVVQHAPNASIANSSIPLQTNTVSSS